MKGLKVEESKEDIKECRANPTKKMVAHTVIQATGEAACKIMSVSQPQTEQQDSV